MTDENVAIPGEFTIPRPQILHQQLIITLFGLYSRTPGTVLPVAAIVALLNDLGYDPPGVRSAVSRLKSKQILHSVPLGRTAAYELTDSLRGAFSEGDERIFAETFPTHAHDWVLALFSVPESRRHLRHQLRKVLSGLGYGTLGSGVWIANGRFMEQTRDRLAQKGLAEYVEFFRGDYFFDGDIKDQVAQWWDLESIDELMAGFLNIYGDAEELWTSVLGADAAQAFRNATPKQCHDAFCYYIPMLTMWRRLPYKDPNLPSSLMPEGWKEPVARRAFVRTHQLIAPLAARHARSIIGEYLPAASV